MKRCVSLLGLLLALSAPAWADPRGEYEIPRRGWASVTPLPGDRLQVERAVGASTLRGVLSRQGVGWSGVISTPGGAVGALTGAGSGSLELTITPRGGVERLRAEWRRGSRRGRETWRRRSPVSTEGSSPLMRAISRASLEHAKGGNLPAELMLTRAGNRVEPRLLIEGPAIFARIADMIAAAEEEVLIQEFHWAPSRAEDLIMEGLRRLEARRKAAGATQPVRVRIVVDKNRLLKELRKTEDSVRAALARTQLDPRYVEVQVRAHTHWLYGAIHAKVFVFDGRSAVITGANVNEWAEAPKTWYELGAVVHGTVAASLRAEFAGLWREKAKRSLPALQTPPPAASGPGVPVVVTSRPARGNLFQDNNDEPASQAYFALFRSAKSHVRIMTPNLNDADVRRELIKTLERGVRVEVVLSKAFGVARIKLPFQGGTNVKNLGRLYRRLKNKPQALARLDVRWFSRPGMTPVEGEAQNSHAKYMSADDEVVIIGCSNMDEQSFDHSREVNLVIEDAALTRGFDAQAFTPIFNRSVRVDLRNP